MLNPEQEVWRNDSARETQCNLSTATVTMSHAYLDDIRLQRTEHALLYLLGY